MKKQDNAEFVLKNALSNLSIGGGVDEDRKSDIKLFKE